MDISKYFNSISHKQLLFLMKRKIRYQLIINLVKKALKAKIFEQRFIILPEVVSMLQLSLLSP